MCTYPVSIEYHTPFLIGTHCVDSGVGISGGGGVDGVDGGSGGGGGVLTNLPIVISLCVH